MKSIEVIQEINLDAIEPGSKNYFWLDLTDDALGMPIRMPIMIAKGQKGSTVMGLTAAVHGNEVNGTQIIQRFFDDLDMETFSGILLAVPVVNVPSFIQVQRRFTDGEDLNRIMPGKANGNDSQVYAHHFIEKVVRKLDFLLDLHTASFGRVNSYYIRVDMKNPTTRKLALLQNAQIIVHNKPSDGTLRGAADELDIPSITLEVGNPNTFQKKMIKSGLEGITNTLSYLEMIQEEIEERKEKSIICSHSYWIYTDVGGLLSVHADLTDRVKKGQHIATIRDVFGNITKEFHAPEDGVVIGKSTSPANQSGGRIIHLGIERNF